MPAGVTHWFVFLGESAASFGMGCAADGAAAISPQCLLAGQPSTAGLARAEAQVLVCGLPFEFLNINDGCMQLIMSDGLFDRAARFK